MARNKQYDQAIAKWMEVLKLDPHHEKASRSINLVQQLMAQEKAAPDTSTPGERKRDFTTAESIPHKSYSPAAQQQAFFSLDYFGVGNFKDYYENDTAAAVSVLANSGFAATGKTDTSAGLGGRIGLRFPMDQGLSVGVSAGYVVGPRAKQNVFGSSGLGNITSTGDTKTSFFRFLLEGSQKIVAIDDNWGFKLGAGLGIAAGHVESDITTSSSGSLSIASAKKNWTGVTWEATPAVYWALAGGGEMEIGLRYSEFPTLKESPSNPKVKWSGWGAYWAVIF